MAILGIGIDIADISRVARVMSRHGGKFIDRICTRAEADFCVKIANSARSAEAVTARFAAKEAFYKALPPALQPLSSWKSVEILPRENGSPLLTICDERLRRALSKLGDMRIHLSISHEKTHCAAMVIIEQR